MTKIQRAQRNYKITRILSYVCGTLAVLAFMYVLGIAGTSDFESEIGEILHSNLWYFVHSALGIGVMWVFGSLANFFGEVSDSWRRYIRKHVGGATHCQ